MKINIFLLLLGLFIIDTSIGLLVNLLEIELGIYMNYIIFLNVLVLFYLILPKETLISTTSL
jgi:hypothetical protein